MIRDLTATTTYSMIGSASALCMDGFTRRLDSALDLVDWTGGTIYAVHDFPFIGCLDCFRTSSSFWTRRNDLEFIAFFGHDMHDVTIFRSFLDFAKCDACVDWRWMALGGGGCGLMERLRIRHDCS
jgi:hypothetical protein